MSTAWALSGKLKVDWHTRTHKSPLALVYCIFCAVAEQRKKLFKRWSALPLHNGQSFCGSLGAGESHVCADTQGQPHSHVAAFCVLSVSNLGVISPLLQGLFALSPWCSGSPIVIKPRKDKSTGQHSFYQWGVGQQMFCEARNLKSTLKCRKL